jgi:ABC-type branched-subunit amino acid transport system ATPase component/predicted MFS family arabinose efflux permease
MLLLVRSIGIEHRGDPVTDVETQPVAAATLVGSVLDAEAERVALQRDERAVASDVPDDSLPGVGAGPVSFRDALRSGGLATFTVLLLLNSLDELEGAALSVLAPDIRDSLGVGNGAIIFITSAAGAFVVLGALPMGWLADRHRRGRIIGLASLVFAAAVALSGLAVNAFMLFWTRFLAGIGKSNTLPVHGSLLADTYPIGARGRISAATAGAGTLVAVLSPAAVGGIAALAGGDEGWRWAFLLLGLPVLVLASAAFRLPEPPRGQHEMLDVLGEVVTDESPAPISVEAAFARLLRIRTLKGVIVGFSALGFGLFSGPVLGNLYVEERFGLDAFDRGLLGSLSGIGVLVVLPFAARHYDALYRRDPASALRLVGLLIIPVGALIVLQYAMPNATAFYIVGVPGGALLGSAFAMVGPVTQSVVPYRLRGMGAALAALYIFFIGATGGALLAGLIADASGPRPAVLAVMAPACVIGGILIARTASSINGDLAMVTAELEEEQSEARRRAAEPAEVPAIQVRDIDFHYGSVQVLFDVGFEVRRGEVLALLGTNGAGKSTILRVIAGLGTPARGVVRHHGRTITYVAPERRASYGIHLLQGGKGTFPHMTVAENLEMGAFRYRSDPADRDRRVAEVLDLFTDLADRRDQVAGSLSGGQQQMLALAVTLLHEPEILLIDELSLGLSPVVVQELLVVVERLKAEGTTMIIVEQSLNVALSIADRAVFLEKGQVRFEGPAAELAERDDLARAVFLGKDGG